MRRRSRLGLLYLLFVLMLSLFAVLRTVLLFKTLPSTDLNLLLLLKIYGTGLLYDGVTFFYFAIPLALLLVVLPDKIYGSRHFKPVAYIITLATTFTLLFGTFAEYLYFSEYGSRFNFIAVDYLMYTSQIVNSIRASFPLDWIFCIVIFLSIVIFLYAKRRIDWFLGSKSTFKHRLRTGSVFAVLPLFSFIFVDLSFTNISQNRYINEIAGNGIYSLCAAYRNNQVDYDALYLTGNEKMVLCGLKNLLLEKNNHFVNSGTDITRAIANPGGKKRLNVIVIVEESLSAEYLTAFGNTRGLTPNLDRLVDRSIFFSHMYATGTRTVRGLEAITLSLPPLPGTSIIKRPCNEKLFSWGTLMRGKGYDTKFIYAGYGCFDNMNYFFNHNGFKSVDRADFRDDEISFANVWGVCDEDLFKRVIKEADESHASGQVFFSLVMTTSNHRPFTYPDGKIDIPSGAGRDGALKYSDYAVGKFMEAARGKTWFDETIFVIVADHCAGSTGKADLPVKAYEIPCLVYSPSHVKPQRIEKVVSQIDVAPTVLGLLHFSYHSKFLGKDILKMDADQERAFISTHEKLGYLKDRRLVVLGPRREAKLYEIGQDGSAVEIQSRDDYLQDALNYYQGANLIYRKGLNRADNLFPSSRK